MLEKNKKQRRFAAMASGVALAVAFPSLALAKKAAPPVVGMELVATVKPERGFVDDPFRFDSTGTRLIYVNADAASLAQVRVLDLANGGVQLSSTDISKVTTSPVRVDMVLDGKHYLVRARAADGAPMTAALVDASGKVKKKYGPARDIALTSVKGKAMVVTYEVTEKTSRKTGLMFHHKIAAYSLKTGRRIGRRTVVVADRNGYSKKLDYTINHWANGYTRIVGVRGGSWNRKEDQRSPDYEAWYDVLTSSFSKRKSIDGLYKHSARMQALATHNNESQFLMIANDLTGVHFVSDGVWSRVGLAEDFGHYDPKSLQYYKRPDGTFVFTLSIDPVNADAVARKVADAKYLDLYELRPGKKKAVRRARKLMTTRRGFNWRATGKYWVLVPRHVGFDRGGKQLQIFMLK